MKELTAEYVRAMLNYNHETGIFRWKVTPRLNVKAGTLAGCIENTGYRRIRIKNHGYLASRLAWLCVHGHWPENHIDHINGVRSDDMISNLRDVTRTGNNQNRRHANKNSKSGLLGVRVDGARFQALIGINGKQIYLGSFATAELANVAYIKAKRELHPVCSI